MCDAKLLFYFRAHLGNVICRDYFRDSWVQSFVFALTPFPSLFVFFLLTLTLRCCYKSILANRKNDDPFWSLPYESARCQTAHILHFDFGQIKGKCCEKRCVVVADGRQPHS